MADTVADFERVTFDKPIDRGQHLTIISMVPKPSWEVKAEMRGSCVTAVVLSVRPKMVPDVARPDSSREVPKSLVVEPTLKAVWDPNPAPFSLTLTALASNRLGKLMNVGSWPFSGEIAPGGHFRLRIDAILDLARNDPDTPPNMLFNIRVKGKRNLTLENINTASAALNIGDSAYELVSKEILALYSGFFNTMYYGGFAESGRSENKMQPLEGESVQYFELAMSLLLEFAHHRSLARVTPHNACLLMSVGDRFQFANINKHIDAHLVQYVSGLKDYREWDEVLLTVEDYAALLPKTERRIVNLYRKTADIEAVVQRLRGTLTAPTLHRLFGAYCQRTKDATFIRCCHIYFLMTRGNVIVQLNRVGMPKATKAVLLAFSPDSPLLATPKFIWDSKRRLVSSAAVPKSMYQDRSEHYDKSSVPYSAAWAFLIRYPKDNRPARYMLTRDRPDGLYLGYVVAGDHVLRYECGSTLVDQIFKNDCLEAGLHYIDV